MTGRLFGSIKPAAAGFFGAACRPHGTMWRGRAWWILLRSPTELELYRRNDQNQEAAQEHADVVVYELTGERGLALKHPDHPVASVINGNSTLYIALVWTLRWCSLRIPAAGTRRITLQGHSPKLIESPI
jgi:hypothetical protein